MARTKISKQRGPSRRAHARAELPESDAADSKTGGGEVEVKEEEERPRSRPKGMDHLLEPTEALLAELRRQHKPHSQLPPQVPKHQASACPSNMGRVGIFIVYTDASKYRHAMAMMRCFAASRGYHFFLVNPYTDPLAVAACGDVQEVMFRKHCAAAEYLQKVDWLLVTDGDTAVLNADRCIEEFLDPSAEILLYERFFSAEIMSGSYIARRSEGATRFMREWARLEKEAPPEPYFFSADNGAVHLEVLRVLYPQRPLLHQYCMSLLRLSEWPEWEIGYGQFLRCAKRHMIEFSLDLLNRTREPAPTVRVRLLPRGQSWCRDAGFTFYHFYPGDFISHNVKEAEPFDEAWLAELLRDWGEDPAKSPLPAQCRNPKWRPRLDPNKSRLVSEAEMRTELASAGTYFAENEKLQPLFADKDIAPCWPNCPDIFRSYRSE